ncbi:MAG: glycosyltransferase family A protein [Thermoleophilia bacterium]
MMEQQQPIPAEDEDTAGAVPVSETAPMVSVVIPLYNGADCITPVLEALYESTFSDFETVVVNDCSTDNSLEVLEGLSERFPFHLINFEKNMGVSKARNTGVREARGEIIIFIDADCIVLPNTIENSINELLQGDSICVGGAYTREPWDKDFFSIFQSLYIHHVETKVEHPDYIATHCLAIRKSTFDEFGGFIEDSFIGHQASVEDVEFCHRMLRAGHQLTRSPNIQVQHMFRFSFTRSVKNAIKKSKYWTMYSLKNRDVTKDSGAASYELKVNVLTQSLNLVIVTAAIVTWKWWLLFPAALLYLLNVAASFKLLRLIKKERGWWFLLRTMAYYQLIYPAVVAYGSAMGTMKYLWEVKIMRRYT